MQTLTGKRLRTCNRICAFILLSLQLPQSSSCIAFQLSSSSTTSFVSSGRANIVMVLMKWIPHFELSFMAADVLVRFGMEGTGLIIVL